MLCVGFAGEIDTQFQIALVPFVCRGEHTCHLIRGREAHRGRTRACQKMDLKTAPKGPKLGGVGGSSCSLPKRFW